MKTFIKKMLKEGYDKLIICDNCGWSWKESESDKSDLYVCHKCGNDNSKKYLQDKK
jgi:protein-arginine kinase activator protein McsA